MIEETIEFLAAITPLVEPNNDQADVTQKKETI